MATKQAKRKTKVFLTPKQKSEIIRLKKKGETIKELAGAYNVTDGTIYRVCKTEKPRKPRTEVTTAMADEMLELRIAGKTHAEIAGLIGVGVATVSRHLKKLGDPQKVYGKKEAEAPVHVIHTDEGPVVPLVHSDAQSGWDGIKITLGIAALLGLFLLMLDQAGLLAWVL